MYVMLSETTIHYVLTTLLILVGIGLFVNKFRPTVVFAIAIVVLLLSQISTIESVFSGFANPSIITIFLLIFITSALRKNFNILGLIDRGVGKMKNPKWFIAAMAGWVAPLSAFVNNTPIVALLIPYIYNWSKKNGHSPSKLLMPITFIATLGGTITVIGTSTHLVLNGFLTLNGFEALKFWDFAPIGVALTLFGSLYLIVWGMNWLPEKKDLLGEFEQNAREYIVETTLTAESPWIGKNIEEAALRNLEGLFLIEINRKGKVISPVSPQEILQEGDYLYFAGETDLVVNLINDNKGLEFPKSDKFNLGQNLEIVEVLIPATSDLAGIRVKDSNFRQRFNAAIVAIHRNGKRIGGKIGDVTLAYGDLLLVSAGSTFYTSIQNQKDLYAVSKGRQLQSDSSNKKRLFLAISCLSLLGVFLNFIPFIVSLLVILGLATALGMYSFSDLKDDLNVDLLIILVCSLALGSALIDTGTAHWLTSGLVTTLSGESAVVLVTGVFLTTVIITSFVTNVAAVAIMFPIVAALIESTGLPAKPIFLGLAYGASAAFLTPVSYQTNLMIYGPGGYTSKDFLKVGFPLTILYSLVSICMILWLL